MWTDRVPEDMITRRTDGRCLLGGATAGYAERSGTLVVRYLASRSRNRRLAEGAQVNESRWEGSTRATEKGRGRRKKFASATSRLLIEMAKNRLSSSLRSHVFGTGCPVAFQCRRLDRSVPVSRRAIRPHGKELRRPAPRSAPEARGRRRKPQINYIVRRGSKDVMAKRGNRRREGGAESVPPPASSAELESSAADGGASPFDAGATPTRFAHAQHARPPCRAARAPDPFDEIDGVAAGRRAGPDRKPLFGGGRC